MEIDSLFGVPAHPLFVHVPVVLTPLALLTAVLVLRTSWREAALWITVGLTGIALAGAQLAAGSGEQLEERVDRSDALHLHAELGATARTFIAIFFVLTLLLALYLYRKDSTSTGERRSLGAIAWLLTAGMILSGVLSTVWVVRAGHQGAKVTWEDVGPADEGDD